MAIMDISWYKIHFSIFFCEIHFISKLKKKKVVKHSISYQKVSERKGLSPPRGAKSLVDLQASQQMLICQWQTGTNIRAQGGRKSIAIRDISWYKINFSIFFCEIHLISKLKKKEVVKHSISYQKVSERKGLSTPRGELRVSLICKPVNKC